MTILNAATAALVLFGFMLVLGLLAAIVQFVREVWKR